jgi:hypothetical protein
LTIIPPNGAEFPYHYHYNAVTLTPCLNCTGKFIPKAGVLLLNADYFTIKTRINGKGGCKRLRAIGIERVVPSNIKIQGRAGFF